MPRTDKILIAAGLALGIIATVGCSGVVRKPHQIQVPHVPYRAQFDPAKCRYLPDGIRFKCKDVVFDPTVIDASGKK